ncbi:PilZ domain-containing protein [Marinicella gelatinilytica]|uniref:PilZ domain-containing protein n=1 Tax=Marinicella gelatinilytica TaxID=2996017 RepID=UPI002260D0E0|nr:PilZ domain-containing protein [Marinicella gelatinilytica]MCX7545768.1 PilZ domain-containing protein [Marinicella gelatinilytica]
MDNRQDVRYARKKMDASCLLLFNGHSYVTRVINISATGILVELIEDKSVRDISLESICILEIVVNETLNIHVSSKVTRIDNNQLGLHFIAIPEDKQVALWQLLGDYVHEVEPIDY